MLTWSKKGLVFETARQGVGGWMRHSALTPTPYRIDDELIRVYAGFRDDDGVSRIGYVDVLADDPTPSYGQRQACTGYWSRRLL